jgi:hypothetical protein
VTTRPGEVDLEPVTKGHEDLRGEVHGVRRQGRVHVDRERRRGGAELQVLVLEHLEGTVVGLLAGLEGQHDVAARRLDHHDLRGTEQHGHVQVVAAGVHGARTLRGEVDARTLGDRQRIHVGTEDRRGSIRIRPADDGGDAGLLVTLRRQPPLTQRLLDERVGVR